MDTKFLGWLLGLENVTSIDEVDPSLAAPWAQEGGVFWVFLGLVALTVLSFVFYLRWQTRGSTGLRLLLGLSRGLLLGILFLTLANPVLRVKLTNVRLPSVFVVFDGTDSMAIQDEYTEQERTKLAESVGFKSDAKSDGDGKPAATVNRSRAEYVQALLSRDDDNLLQQLAEKKKCKVETFVFDGNTTSQLRRLAPNESGGERLDPKHIAEQLTSKGQVTAIGSVLNDIGQQFGTGNLGGVILFSDFDQNAGPAPLGGRRGQEKSPASSLGVPIYTVGVGATEAVDIAVDIQTDPKMKKAEKTNVIVKLRQTGMQGRTANVKVTARRLGGDLTASDAEIEVGQKTVTLTGAVESVEFPFTPKESGRFEFFAEVEPVTGEIVEQNNRASREVNIIDDYLRLMFVAHEPTWEWRFVKEVFHRDKLVGMEGFRTYLASSDPQVRETNVLFLPTLTPKRSEFFANDVIFLDDMPQQGLGNRFCEMVKEFVGKFGGGLVVIAGPRFGPTELANTPLADMLPVVIDPEAKIRDEREFRVRITPHADRYPFMLMGGNDVENRKAWDNLGQLNWYQPVANLHRQAVALAEHPQDMCQDGKTPQPLISVRPYGSGEVVFLSFNETWRLRKKFGERYYRQFWSQLIYRLGMSHALGSQKRFVVRTDRQEYRAEETVTLMIEAYDENFDPLTEEKLGGRTLTAELTLPSKDTGATQTREIPVSLLRAGVFEARIPVFTAGEYGLRIKDPVTSKYSEVRFGVASVSAERRSGVRNLRLQQEIADATDGQSYDLTTVSKLVDDLKLTPITESYTRNHALWSTPLWFIVVVALMLGEWLVRKLINLT